MYQKLPAKHEKVDLIAAVNNELFSRSKLLHVLNWVKVRKKKWFVCKEKKIQSAATFEKKRKEFDKLYSDSLVGIFCQISQVIHRLWSRHF